MKHIKTTQAWRMLLIFVLLPFAGFSQGLSYESAAGDLLNARIYTLENGMKVYLSVNKNEPRIQTCIAVKAGSKNDPSDATGLAHYLEHMLFKGTDQYGTLDFSKEKPLLDKIEALFEVYRQTTDTAERRKLYAEIDATSGEAAKYAIANEYDKMVSSIGASGTNAYTSFEQTVYVNEIPANAVDAWLQIESERFRNPVFRIFHTELEAVYEEKNISLDRDGSRVFEGLFAGLFKNHNYGLQTTIGTVEHLKNPSIRKIREYYEKNYVPNNMAIIMAGDLDPDKTIALIQKYFSSKVAKPVSPYTFQPEQAITEPRILTVNGPDAEYVQFAYRFPGAGTRDALVLEMMDYLLSNSTAGLLDLNLNQKQKVLSAGSSAYILKDYSVHLFNGRPRQGQSLEEVAALIQEQIERVKKGEFDSDMPAAIVNNMEIEQIRGYEENSPRANAMVDAFTLGMDWKDYASKLTQMRSITKEEIVATANKYYGNNYVIVYKRTGPRDQVVKVTKPAITPVEVNREAQSDFLKKIENAKMDPIGAHFLDFSKDLQFGKTASGIAVEMVPNKENQLFSLSYLFEMGSTNNKTLDVAIQYLNYLGTDRLSNEELKKQFYKLGCSFNVTAGQDRSYVTLSGLNSNFKPAVELFESLLSGAKADEAALQNLINDQLKSRADMKLNKNVIRQGMLMYGMYGPKNPFNDRMPEAELKALKAGDLVSIIHGLTGYEHKILYYGPLSMADLNSTMDSYHKMNTPLKPVPPQVNYVCPPTKKNQVFFVDYDMVQAELQWVSNSGPYNAAEEPVISLFNEYFGGGMGSIVFQTIRESKALAYSTYSRFMIPQKKTVPFFTIAYVGTQADKLHEAAAGMLELVHTMPEASNLFETAKASIKSQMETSRITREDILWTYESHLRKGVDHDLRADIYAKAPGFSMSDLKAFHKKNYADRKYSLMLLASTKKVDLKSLKKYGKVNTLTLTDIFGY